MPTLFVLLVLFCQWYFNGKFHYRRDYVHHQKFCIVCLFFQGVKCDRRSQLVLGCDLTDQGPINAMPKCLRLQRSYFLINFIISFLPEADVLSHQDLICQICPKQTQDSQKEEEDVAPPPFPGNLHQLIN